MKKYKKIITGLLVLTALSVFFSFSNFQKALAFSANDITNGYFYLTSGLNSKTGTLLSDIVGEIPKGNTSTAVTFKETQIPTFNNPTGVFTVDVNNNPFCVPQVYADATGKIKSDFAPKITVNFDGNQLFNNKKIVSKSINYQLYSGSSVQDCVLAQNTVAQKTIDVNTSAAPIPPTGTGSAFTKADIDAITDSNVVFTDAAHIQLTIKGASAPLVFTDNVVYDDSPKYEMPANTFCGGNPIILNPAVKANDRAYLTGDTIPATITLGFLDTTKAKTNPYPCTNETVIVNIKNPNQIATKIFNWDGTKLVSLTGGLKLAALSEGAGTKYVEAGSLSKACGGGYEIILPSSGAGSGQFLEAQSHSSQNPLGGPGQSGTCMDNPKQNRSVLIGGTYNTTLADGAPPGASSSCESSYKGAAFEFNWISCAILRGLDSIINTIYGQVEGQLFFCTGASATSGATCSGNLLPDSGPNNVKSLWAIFRNLTSGLLVIIMLIMVLSQSFGNGILDAYTVKKVLPRLVIAALLMQLSWYVFKWFIDVSNDLGRGIGDLMYYPFGGPGKFDLDNLVGASGSWSPNALTASVGLTTGMLLTWGGFTPFGFLFIGLGVIASILIGLFVLLFRQILIILCMILAPLALVAWVLPGTQKYFKLWQDNFVKLLMMFPMIIAMIAAGRIFALIGSQAHGGFIGMLIILLGVFGPLFFLPKTFKWGGSAFGALANGIWGATNKARNAPLKMTKDTAAETRKYRALERNQRIANDPAAASRIDRLFAGNFNYLRQSKKRGQIGVGARDARYAQTIHEGEEAARKNVGQELLIKGYQNWSHMDKLDALEAWLKGGEYRGISAEGNEALRLFAFKTLADLGDSDRIRNARREGKLTGSVWLKGRAENFSALNQQASDMGLTDDLSKLSADAVPNLKGHTIDEFLRQVEEGYTMDNSEKAGADARVVLTPEQHAQQIERAATLAQAIVRNQLVFDRLDADKQAKVISLATKGGTLTDILRKPGGNTEVIVPSGRVLAENEVARNSLVTALTGRDVGRAKVVAEKVAQELVKARLEPGSVAEPDAAGLQATITRIENAAAAGSDQMARANNQILAALKLELDKHVQVVEQRAVASGISLDRVKLLVDAEKARVNTILDEIGLRPVATDTPPDADETVLDVPHDE